MLCKETGTGPGKERPNNVKHLTIQKHADHIFEGGLAWEVTHLDLSPCTQNTLAKSRALVHHASEWITKLVLKPQL